MGDGRSRFAYVSQYFSQRYQKTYTIVDIREYRDIERIPNSTEFIAKPTVKGVALNSEEFSELCRLIPQLKEDLELKLTTQKVAETPFEDEDQLVQRQCHNYISPNLSYPAGNSKSSW